MPLIGNLPNEFSKANCTSWIFSQQRKTLGFFQKFLKNSKIKDLAKATNFV